MKNKKIYSVISIIIALILIFVGIKKGDFNDYYRKAIMVCTQCIGIG